jgi:hypothetical protein
MDMDTAKKFNRRIRSAKWMADYQNRATDARRRFRAAEMQMKLNNWLNNNATHEISTYGDRD